MKVRYIKKGFGHEVGVVIDTTPKIASTLLRRGICETFVEKDLAAEQVAKKDFKEAETKLKDMVVAEMPYPEMQKLVATLGLVTENAKKETLVAALEAHQVFVKALV